MSVLRFFGLLAGLLLLTGCPTTNITTPTCSPNASATAGGGPGGSVAVDGEGSEGAAGASASAAAGADCTPGIVKTE